MLKTINYQPLKTQITEIFQTAKKQAYSSVNQILVQTYWQIGKLIVEFEQEGNIKAEYGKELLVNLSKDLKPLGKGFSRSNLAYMRQFYLLFPKSPDASGKLTWSHYVEMLGIENDLARGFYEKQCEIENWSVRELKRQKNSMLFERLIGSDDQKKALELATKGQRIERAGDLIKEPFILEFLGIPENYLFSERELEQKLIDNLQNFLLELGKGFTFVKRQFRISLDSHHHYVDLVFYHRILKCFILIDLKIGEVDHSDIGQMNMYLNYFKIEENMTDDNEPIGIILSAEKNNIKVEYALGSISNQLFVSKYKIYLPTKEELLKQVRV